MSIVISGGGGGGGGATTLNGLSDVNITSVANGQIIAYNNTSGNWENRTGISGGLTYKGAFNATAGTPSIVNALQGDFYVIDTAGTIYGQTWAIGDHLLINEDMGGSVTNSKIDKVDNTDLVVSVNGQTGAVSGLLEAGNNLSDLSNVPTARSNLSLGSAAVENVGTGANNVVQLDGSSRLPAVDGSQLTNLPAAPVSSVAGRTGAVVIYSDDVGGVDGTGLTISGTGATSALNVDAGTGASQIVQLDGSSRLPAVDGSQLTNLPAAPVSSVNGATGAVNIYADDATLNLAGTGIVTSGTGATSTLNVDVGTTASKVVQLDGSARLPAVDGSQLTNLPSAPVTSVSGRTGVVVLYSDDVGGVDGTGLTISGTGATSALNVDAGTGANQIVQLDGSSRLPAVDGSQLTNIPGASRPTVTTDNSGADATIPNPAASDLEDVYLVDNGAAAVNITLPAVGSNSGYKVQIKRLGTANVTVTPASGTIDDAANQVLSVQFSSFTCVTDGTDWHII